MDAIHVIAGVLIQLAGVLLWRRRLASIRLWLLVLVLAVLNEVHDLWAEQWPSLGMQLGEGLKDLVLTMLLPTLLLLLARQRPALLVPLSPPLSP